MPKVSVVIPTYNREEYICETIDSVLDQSFKDFEIIIVDDGSTDNTLEKISKYKNKIKIVKQKNSERAISRNNGVKNSTGEYIAFLDSDDLWTPLKLEKQVEILDSKNNVVLINSASNRIDENGQKTTTAQRQMKGYSGDVFEKLLFRNFIVSATPLVRREVLEKTDGFITKYIPYEDWHCWLKLSTLGDFYFIEEPLAYYRIHSAQSVQNVSAEKIEEVTTLLLEDSYSLRNISEKTINKSRAVANLRYCYWYIINKDFSTAKEKAKKALHYNKNLAIDPRWIGLRATCNIPALRDIFKLETLHKTY